MFLMWYNTKEIKRSSASTQPHGELGQYAKALTVKGKKGALCAELVFRVFLLTFIVYIFYSTEVRNHSSEQHKGYPHK